MYTPKEGGAAADELCVHDAKCLEYGGTRAFKGVEIMGNVFLYSRRCARGEKRAEALSVVCDVDKDAMQHLQSQCSLPCFVVDALVRAVID